MKGITRLLSLLLAVSLIAALFAGCNTTPSNNEENPTAEPTESNVDVTPTEGTDVTPTEGTDVTGAPTGEVTVTGEVTGAVTVTGTAPTGTTNPTATKKVTATPTKKVATPTPIKGEPVQDLGGMKWTLMSSYYGDEWQPAVGSARRDEMDAIIKDVEKKFNCDIILKTMVDNAARAIQQSVASGSKPADLIQESTRTNCFIFSKGYAYRLDTIKSQYQVDLNVSDSTLFFQPATRAFNMDGRGIYAFSWASKLMLPQFGSIILFNKQMLSAAGYDPYTLVRQGKWTYAKFAEISQAIAKFDSNGKPTILGSYTSSMNQNRVFIFTNSSRILKFDGRKYVYVGNQANTVESIDFLNDLINVKKSHMTKYDGVANYAGYEDAWKADAFGQGKIGMVMPPWKEIADTTGLKPYLANATFDWGVLPLPKGPKNTTNVYQSMITDPRVYFILTSVKQSELKKGAVIINALARRLNNSTWEAEMKTRLRDAASLDMIKTYIFPGLFMDIFMGTEADYKYLGYNGFIAGVCEQILSRKMTAQSGMNSITATFQKYVDNTINYKLK